jgi:hypothetical protein
LSSPSNTKAGKSAAFACGGCPTARHSLQTFIDDVGEPGSLVHTDGWLGYDRVQAHGYRHRITFLSDHPEPAHDLLPRVHLVSLYRASSSRPESSG